MTRMIMFIAEHWVQDDQVEAAKTYLEMKAREQAVQPGFVRRYTVSNPDDPTKITSVTLWQSREHFNRWVNDVMPTLPSTGTFGWRRYWSESSEVHGEQLPMSS